jgi:phenylacetate-CoA ligase
MKLPLLLMFGRKDSTISYMGANLYPQDVEYGLYAGNPMAAEIARFSLSLAELPGLESRPVVNIELRPEADLGADGAARCRDGVLAHLTRVSRDFAESLSEDPAAADLQVRVFAHGEGPFRGPGTIKNVYLTTDQA